MKEFPIIEVRENDGAGKGLISLNKLKNIMNDPALLIELINKAIESLEEAKAEVQQASLDNNTKKLKAAIHKITPIFHYLEAASILDVITYYTKTILTSTLFAECSMAYTIIIKNIDHTLAELIEKNKAL